MEDRAATALPEILTGIMLGIARVARESAPLHFTLANQSA
jgi:ABC-type phosphate transport system permease subunit